MKKYSGKTYAIALVIILIIYSFWYLRPVPKPTKENIIPVLGQVVRIYESGEKDISIELKNDSRHFYINRGLEQGLSLKVLNNKLMHKQAKLYYINYWQPLPESDTRHLAKVEISDEILFSEKIN